MRRMNLLETSLLIIKQKKSILTTNHNLFLKSVIILSLLFQGNNLKAEGTKEIMKPTSDTTQDNARFVLSKAQSTGGIYGYFAVPQANEDEQIWFTVSSTTEKVFYGMNWGTGSPSGTYCIKDHNHNIVKSWGPVPTTGAGYIQYYSQASKGPSQITPGGYNALVFNPPLAGDYYIQFDYNPGGMDIRIKYLDITVATAANIAILGRVWSKDWFLSTEGSTKTFKGKMYPYSDDMIVTEIDFDQMMPYYFRVSCNSNGCNSTETFTLARMSRAGRSTYPQYRIFLNNPDPVLYPSGVIGNVDSVRTVNDCDGLVNTSIYVNKTGIVEMLLNVDPTPGYQPQDVLLSMDVQAGKPNILVWDGNNGYGNPVPNGTIITLAITYINGLTNLPMYDVEGCNNGFKVALVRPSGPVPKVFWDDINVGGSQEFNGCLSTPTTGCHSWPYSTVFSLGNERTINTWWYSISTAVAPISFQFRRSNFIQQNLIVCQGDSLLIFGQWQSQPGVFTDVTTNFMGCDSTTEITLVVKPGPVLELGPDQILCQGGSTVLDATGPSGTTYLWNTGATTPTITVNTTNTYSVTITASNGCVKSDAVYILATPFILPKPIKHN